MAIIHKNLPHKLFEVPWVVLISIILLPIGVGFVVGSLPGDTPLAIPFVIAGLLLFAIMLFSPRWNSFIFATYIFAFLAAYDFVGYDPVSTFPIKLYFADVIWLFMVALALQVLRRQIALRDFQSPITLLLFINFVFGGIAVLIGFFAGNSVNNIFGDFRRFFLYPLVALYALSVPVKRSDLKKLVIMFGFALIILSVGALIRFATGSSWRPEQFNPNELMGNQFRAMGYFSGVLVSMGVGVFYAIYIIGRGYRKIVFLVVMLVFEAALFASGYRLLWVAGVFVPVVVAYISARGLGKGLRTLSIGVVILVLLTGLILFARFFSPDIYNVLTTRFHNEVYHFDFSTTDRYYGWTAAWSKFLSSPILGIGIGDQFEYLTRGSGGGYFMIGRSTHNIVIGLLYQTGVLGTGLFLMIHITFTWYVWRGLSRVESRARIALIGMLAGYFFALMMAMVQPMLETPSAIAMFYLWMGFTLNIFRMFSGKESNKKLC